MITRAWLEACEARLLCSAGPVLQDAAGLLVVEAEDFDQRVDRSGHGWEVVTRTDASGGAAVAAYPNDGTGINAGYVGTSPELVFRIRTQHRGTHYLWFLGRAATATDDSLHFGLDGQGPADADRVTLTRTDAWQWTKNTQDGPRPTLVVGEPGDHTLHVWMREDGLTLDKVLVTTDPGFVPTGAGPAASPRADDTPPPPPPPPPPPSDGVAPRVAVNSLATLDTTPALTGVVSHPDAAVTVTVNGRVYAAAVDGNTWTLADNVLAALPAGTFDVQATATDPDGDRGVDATAGELTVIVPPPPRWGYDQHATPGRQLVIEAEQFDKMISRGGKKWTSVKDSAAAGGKAMQATPNSGATVQTSYTTKATELVYHAWFSEVGTHQFWVRGKANGTADDTIHVGVDGAGITTSEGLRLGGTKAWTWSQNRPDGGPARITITEPGFHTLHVWMREDGFLLDKIVLSHSSLPPDTGTGPAPSPRTDRDTIAPSVRADSLAPIDRSPPVTGYCNEPAAIVDVTINNRTYRALPTTRDGDPRYWHLPDNTLDELPLGSHVIYARAIDAFGNVGVSDTGRLMIRPVDSPYALDLDPASDTGSSATDHLTKLNNATPDRALTFTMRHNAIAGYTIRLFAGDTLLGSTVATAALATTITTDGTAALPDGNHAITAEVVTPHGTSPRSTPLTITIDTTPPAVTVQPVWTHANAPNLYGTVDPDVPAASVAVALAGQTVVAQPYFTLPGRWQVSSTQFTALPRGVHDVSVTATDAAGNVGADTTTNEVTLAPNQPFVHLRHECDTGANDGVTFFNNASPDRALRFTVGNLVPGATVDLWLAGQLVVSATATADTLELSTDGATTLADGNYTAYARQSVGGASSSSTINSRFRIDTVPPVVQLTTTTSPVPSPALRGTSSKPATITVTYDGVAYPTYSHLGTGNPWELPGNRLPPLAPGVYPLTLDAVDYVGLTARTTATLTIVPFTPAAPQLAAASDTGASAADLLTRLHNGDPDHALSFAVGNTTPGALVELLVGGTVVGSATATGATTAVTTAGDFPLADGGHAFVARQTVHGQPSATSARTTVTIDATPPAATVTPRTTTDTTPPLAGTFGEAGLTVAVAVNGQSVPITVTGTAWSIADNALAPLPVGSHDVTVTVTDVAGNVATDATVDELTIAPPPAFVVKSTNLTDGGFINYHTTTLGVQFLGTIDAATVSADDLTINGVPATGFTLTGPAASPTGVTFKLPDKALLPDGPALATLAAAAIRDTFGQPSPPLTANLTVDRTPPRIVAASLQKDDVLPAGPLTVVLDFDSPVRFTTGAWQEQRFAARLGAQFTPATPPPTRPRSTPPPSPSARATPG